MLAGLPVVREVSYTDVKRYLLANGYRSDSTTAVDECFVLIATGDTKHSSRPLFLATKCAHLLHESILDIAHRLGREPDDVLRQIAGEHTTLADAFNALVDVLHARIADYMDVSGDVPYALDTADTAFIYASDWRDTAHNSYNMCSTTDSASECSSWLLVMRAAEDLAAIALDILRKGRVAVDNS